MTKQQEKQFKLIAKRLLSIDADFSKLFSESVTKRMPITSAMVMDNIAFGIMIATSSTRGMLDIIHDEKNSAYEEAEDSEQEGSAIQRRARVGHCKVFKKPNNRTRQSPKGI